MNRNTIKHYTLCLMAALVGILIIWSIFGSRGSGSAPLPPAQTSQSVADPESDRLSATSAPDRPTAPAAEPEPTPGSRPDTSEPSIASQAPTPVSSVLTYLSLSDTVRSLNPYEAHFDSMPPGGIKMHINSIGGPLARVFNDSNHLHIAAAEARGIQPIHTLKDAWTAGAQLQHLNSCEAYYLDNLTHSLPYLTPHAHQLLTDIGLAFRDSLKSRGGGDYRIKVTSVLRTPRLVRRLRRTNVNSIEASAHLYATTFDISYAKFICDSTRTPRTQEDLKNLLAEVVADMHRQNRCFVKYERKQACFHITAR